MLVTSRWCDSYTISLIVAVLKTTADYDDSEDSRWTSKLIEISGVGEIANKISTKAIINCLKESKNG